MTALIAHVGEKQAAILTDTLCSTTDQPYCFNTKVFTLPHLRMAFAVIGTVSVGVQWFLMLNDWLGQDIVEIDRVAPGRLRQIWRWKHRRGRPTPLGPTHILHFGYPQAENGIKVFQYHSEDDFQSHPGQQGLLTIPEVQPPMPSSSEDRLRCLIAAMREQREQFRRDGKPYAVGGEIQLVELLPDRMTSCMVHRFEDFDEILGLVRQRVAGEEAAISSKPQWVQRLLRRAGRIP